MRTKNTIINSFAGAISYIVIMLSNFVVRAVFVQQLGKNVLGVNALFTNIISMLALAELGLGTGLIYKLYKPVADHDVPRIQSLLRFYKRAYMLIGSFILTAGFALSFFVYVFDKEKIFTPVYLGTTFFLFVLDVLASYLFAHQKALITADQKNYIINVVHAGTQVITCVFQIVLLIITQSFAIYIVVKIICRVGEGFAINWKYRRLYPDITLRGSKAIHDDERRDLFHNIHAMLFHRIGSFSLSSTSNMIISYFVNLATVGLYSNYTLISNTINNLIAQMFQGVTASFGDLLNTENRDKAYDRFNILFFMNFLLVSFCSISLFMLIEPFIKLWIGSNFLLDRWTLILLVINFYVYGMRRVVFVARDSAGLYTPDKYMPLLEAAINLGLSIWLVQYWGVKGVLTANLISMLLIPFWIQPLIVYRHIFNKSITAYYIRYVCYAAAAAFSGGVTVWISSFVTINSVWLTLLFNGVICLIVPNTINLVLFLRTSEFRYVWNLVVSAKTKLMNYKSK